MKIRYFDSAFIDTAYSLMKEFKEDESNTLVILGLNVMLPLGINYEEVIKGYDKVIIYNQENYYGVINQYWFNDFINIMKKCDEVWNYDEANIPLFEQYGINSKLHLLKPYMDWDMYAKVDKDIDILVYGTITERRKTLIDFLQHSHKVITLENKYATDIDEYILRSNILLNVHSSGEQLLQEQARMVKWIGAPCQIISEKSIHNYLNVPELNYWELFCL